MRDEAAEPGEPGGLRTLAGTGIGDWKPPALRRAALTARYGLEVDQRSSATTPSDVGLGHGLAESVDSIEEAEASET